MSNEGSDNLTTFFQVGPGVFDPVPMVLGDSSVTDLPNAVIATDLDSDGDLELVSANFISGSLTIFFQDGTGLFDPVPLALTDPSPTFTPSSVTAADFDGDGNLDLAASNFLEERLTVFFQSAPSVFNPSPLRISGPRDEWSELRHRVRRLRWRW